MVALPYILQGVRAAGHAVFTEGDWNVNIVVVRSAERVAGAFDDRIYLPYKLGKQWFEPSWSCTADPGLHYLQNPMNLEGTLSIAAGQYRGAYVVGKHKGYPALRQDLSVMVHRDNNRDNILDFPPPVVAPGTTRANIHAADLDPFDLIDRVRKAIGRWSAGCIVFEDSADYREFWDIIMRSAALYGRRFTLTVIDAPLALGRVA